jgi:hypothetical protein
MATDKSAKNPKKYICLNCDYNTSDIKDYKKHCKTKKHITNTQSTFSINKSEKNPYKYICSICNYKTNDSKDYTKHLESKKHIYNCQPTIKSYVCEYCNKEYKERTGLYKHKQKCSNTENCENIIDTLIPDKMINLVLELVKQNSEFKELLVEQNKQNQTLQNQFIELAKDKTIQNSNNISNSNNTTNSNNQFNLQVFLNETCKNAMNINEFIEQIPINLSDLEDTARLGYVEGISRIFIRSLKELEVNERPIHCTDAKRETLYIKEGDVWEKDDSAKTKLTNAIRKVGTKNIRMINEWKRKYPDCEDYYSNKNDLYLSIVNNSMCGGTEEETLSNYNKIKKNIIKQVVIPK